MKFESLTNTGFFTNLIDRQYSVDAFIYKFFKQSFYKGYSYGVPSEGWLLKKQNIILMTLNSMNLTYHYF